MELGPLAMTCYEAHYSTAVRAGNWFPKYARTADNWTSTATKVMYWTKFKIIAVIDIGNFKQSV